MKDFARVVYRTKAWQDCREAYAKSKGYLCERCLKKGIYSPGVIVHHKIHLNPDNVTDPRIAMSFDNLELLCRFCHAEEHEEEIKEAQAKRPSKRRYTIDEQGRVKCLL